MILFIANNSTYIIAGLVVAVFVLLVMQLIQSVKYKKFTSQSGEVNIEEVLVNNQKELAQLTRFQKYFEQFEKENKSNIDGCINKIEVKKYNAFDGMGGELSAIICMLNNNNDGVLIHSIHTRESNHIYTKEITNGKSIISLSKEEKELLEKAMG